MRTAIVLSLVRSKKKIKLKIGIIQVLQTYGADLNLYQVKVTLRKKSLNWIYIMEKKEKEAQARA